MKTKISFFVLVLTSILFSCGNGASSSDTNLIESSSTADNPEGNGKEPIITFEHETWDFGTIIEGEVVEHSYTFKNTGTKPLLISDVQASCGCTIPEWPREPIATGQEGTIKLQFNSNGKSENINKDVTIFSNANPIKKKLTFTAYVKKKPEAK
jgi:hypothetical protein